MTTKAIAKLNDDQIGELTSANNFWRKPTREILAMFLMTGSAFAQTTTHTGTIKDLSFNPVTAGQVPFHITPTSESTVTSMRRFAPSRVTCKINTKGTL